MSTEEQVPKYEVLSPWAEINPVPLKGLTASRLTDLVDKRIGLYCNNKRAARPILAAMEKLLKAKYSIGKTSWFMGNQTSGQEFEDWITNVDAVIAAVGD